MWTVCGWHWPYPLWREGRRWPFCQASSIPYSQLKPFSAPLPPSIHPSPRLPFSCHNFPFALESRPIPQNASAAHFPSPCCSTGCPRRSCLAQPHSRFMAVSCAAARHRHRDSSMVAVAAASMAHSNCSRIYLPVGRGLPLPLPLFPFFPPTPIWALICHGVNFPLFSSFSHFSIHFGFKHKSSAWPNFGLKVSQKFPWVISGHLRTENE